MSASCLVIIKNRLYWALLFCHPVKRYVFLPPVRVLFKHLAILTMCFNIIDWNTVGQNIVHNLLVSLFEFPAFIFGHCATLGYC